MSRNRRRTRRVTAPSRARAFRLNLESLECRTLPAVTFFNDAANPGKSIVQFTEDAPGASDTLVLSPTSGGQLQYRWNGGALSTDLKSSQAGIQALSLSAISRIDVLLGNGNNLLDVDATSSPALFPSPSGIVFAGGNGTDTLIVRQDASMTLTATSATTSTGGLVSFSSLELAQLIGGNSNNLLDASGFAGNATLDGGNGDDTMIGGSGNDVLLGTSGKDFLDGRGGNDQLFSGNSGPTMLGGDGDDTLFGGNGADFLDGGAGNDVILGSNGQDTCLGGDGNDSINGGNGNDLIDGGTGTDRVVGSDNVSWTVSDSTLTGEGTDTLTSIEEAQLTGGNGNNTIDASGFHGATTLQGGGGIDTLIGGFGSNLFVKPQGEIGNETMIGGPAGSTNDYQIAPQGATTLISSGGFDIVDFSIALAAITFDLNVTNGAPQVVMADGSTVALNGAFEQLIGSNSTDTLTAASNSTVIGGAGQDLLIANQKNNVTLQGGADTDTLQQTGGTNIVMSGDSGVDTLVSVGGTGITMSGGSDADSLQLTGGTNITMSGDSGTDSLISTNSTGITMNGGSDADTLQQIGGTNIIMQGDTGTDTLVSTNGSGITMNGGSDADTLQQTGGTTIIMQGDSGLDTLISISGTQVTMNGGSDADTLQQTGGTTITMSGDDGADSLISNGGTTITMTGGADADTLQQSGGTFIVMSGDSGLDTLVSTSGSQVTMNGGSDADSLLQTGGTTITMSGDDGADALYSTSGQTIIMNGGSDADSLISTGDATITMSGDSGTDTLVSIGSTNITMSGGSDADLLNLTDQTPIVESTVTTLDGGTGDDTYVIVGNSPGAVNIVEAAGAGVDSLDLSSFTGGPVTLDLSLPTIQALGTVPGNSLTLSDGQGIENVIGTSGADIIRGNDTDNQLSGASLPPAQMGTAPGWDGVTQVVFLDFDSRTDPGEHFYTAAERSAILARMSADYVGPDPAHPWFHFQFTTTAPSSGDYATVYFNDLPANLPNDQGTGGFSDDLDFRNTRLGGTAYVQVNGILGAPNQPPDTTDNWIALSEKIAAHEVGHLAGLLHQDSFGPIGYGIHSPPGAAAYNPPYPGPVAAYETFNHIMGSPASVGSTRFNDIGDLFFGEREAIKLAFSESGTVIGEQAGAHQSFATAQAVPLVPLAVPNTLSFGLNANKQFYVEAVDVTGSIGLDANTGLSENDFYSFTGKKGDLMSFEILSKALTRLGSNTIDAMIRVMDTSGNVLAFRGGSAFNDDQFEPTDPSLFDFRLPADGTYIVEVDTFSSASTPDTDTGAYELFMYRFKAFNPTDGGDVLDGRGGNDSLFGGAGNDVLTGGAGNDVMDGGAGNDTFVGLPSGNDAAVDSAGRDTLDFSTASLGITLNLALDAGQTQVMDSAGNTLGLTGTFEIVFGTALADVITGNSADNTIYGLAGNDSLAGDGGNDVLSGGDGNDTLLGGDGNDLLLAGTGADTLQGQAGDDILIGGPTIFDANQSALDALMAEWTSADSYTQRVSYLTGTAGGANGTTFLIKGTTVLDDGIKDDLTGGLGTDLFFKFGPDSVNDKEKTETVI